MREEAPRVEAPLFLCWLLKLEDRVLDGQLQGLGTICGDEFAKTAPIFLAASHFLPIMHGDCIAGVDLLHRFSGLDVVHCENASDWEQGNIAPNLAHLGDQVGVTRKVDVVAHEGDQETETIEGFVVKSLVDRVGWHGPNRYLADVGSALPRAYDLDLWPYDLGNSRIGKNRSAILPDPCDVLRRTVIMMIVTDQDDICRWTVWRQPPGINVNDRPIVIRRAVDSEAGMTQPMNSLYHGT
jgi:hypothetical protein